MGAKLDMESKTVTPGDSFSSFTNNESPVADPTKSFCWPNGTRPVGADIWFQNNNYNRILLVTGVIL